jgi:hypothetical protein
MAQVDSSLVAVTHEIVGNGDGERRKVGTFEVEKNFREGLQEARLPAAIDADDEAYGDFPTKHGFVTERHTNILEGRQVTQA